MHLSSYEPFSFERFLKAVNKAIHVKDKVPSTSQRADNLSTGKIFLYSDKKHIQVKMDDIYYVEAAGNYCRVVLRDKTIMVREKISDMLDNLSSEYFIKVHKSFIVAREHITVIEGNRILIDEHEIPIGKMYKNNVLALLKGN